VALLDIDRPVVERLLVPVDVTDERLDATLEVEGALSIDSLVDERDPDALRQVRGLPEALADRLERVLDRLEHRRVGHEVRGRATPRALRPDLAHGRLGLAALVLLHPDVALAGRLDAHRRGQRVDDAHADTMEAARDLVAAAAEL